jgi:uncharacterized membrane protein
MRHDYEAVIDDAQTREGGIPMLEFALGLLLFFGTHSISMMMLPLRDRLAAKSEIAWKLVYGAISLVGLVLIARGYAELRMTPYVLYVAPVWLQHVAALLLLPMFVLFFAPYFPGRISTAAKHPQLVAVKLWAVAHLLVNGTIIDLVLFGTFLLWAVANRISLNNRPARAVPGLPEAKTNDLIVIVLGLAVYVATVFWLHGLVIGIKPFS